MLSKDQIKQLQSQLQQLGLYSLKIDGLLGDGTFKAMQNALEKLSVLSTPTPPVKQPATVPSGSDLGMVVDYDVAMELAYHEAIIRQAYKDSGDKWTWSVGLTNATGHDVTRYIDNPQPLQRCLDVYVWALRRYADQVIEVFKDVPLTHSQFAAAVSFHWNTGRIRNASWPTFFKDGKLSSAKANWLSYNINAGKVNPGLTERRTKEVNLFFNGIWSNDGKMVEYTQVRADTHTPVWSSAKRIDVSETLQISFGTSIDVQLDMQPKPDVIPLNFTLTK